MAGEALSYTLFQQEPDRANSLYNCSMCSELVKYHSLREHAQIKHGSIDITMNTNMVRRIHFSVAVDESWLANEIVFHCKYPGCGQAVSGGQIDAHAITHEGQVITIDESTLATSRHTIPQERETP